MQLSNAKLGMYLSCPQCYRFRYVDRLPEKPRAELCFGSLVHGVLQFLHDPAHTTTPSLEQITEKYEHAWKDLPEIEGLAEYKPIGLQMLRNYYRAHVPLDEQVLAVERKFRLPLSDHTLIGVIDRVGRTKDGKLVITDYKTSSKLPTQPEVDRDRQMTIYHHCAQNLYPEKPVIARLHFLRFDYVFETEPSEEAWMGVEQELLRAAYGIESGHFKPRPGWRCEYCDYVTLCPAMRHMFESRRGESELFDGIDIKEAAREYVELKEDTRSSKIKMEELSAKINAYMESKGYTRLFVDDILISRIETKRPEWNQDELIRVLERLGLKARATDISIHNVRELLDSEDVTPEQKSEIASCMKTRTVHSLRYRLRYEDGD